MVMFTITKIQKMENILTKLERLPIAIKGTPFLEPDTGFANGQPGGMVPQNVKNVRKIMRCICIQIFIFDLRIGVFL